jgi:hypothetical protein
MTVPGKHSGCNCLMTPETVLGAALYFALIMTLFTSFGKRGMQDVTHNAFAPAAMWIVA